MADWSQLPTDLLTLIARRLHFVDDYVRFGIVCKTWRAVFLQKDHLCSLLPWLILPENKETGLCEFYCPFNETLYGLHLPEIRGRRCWGSSYGWLVTLDAEYQMHLLNPISRVQILLPPLHKCSNIKIPICDPIVFQCSFVEKVILSSNPLSENCVVLAIYSYDDNRIAFSKPGDEAWTPLQCSPGFVFDAICFDGMFYFAALRGRAIIICDSNGLHLKKVDLKVSLRGFEHDEIVPCIVELSGQIHVIYRIMFGTSSLMRTWTFKVLRLDICTEKWEDVENLGNWSIFLGTNHSFSIRTSDYPECSSNCIYFSDVELYPPTISRPYDMGIYKLDHHEIQYLPEGEKSRYIYPLPVWIKPVLW